MLPRAKALEAGEKYYHSGKDCKAGHPNPQRRSSTASCIPCHKESERRRRKEAGRRSHKEHPKRIAAKNGDKTYEGKECKHGHGTTRYTASSGCLECARIYATAYNRKVGVKPRKPAKPRLKIYKDARITVSEQKEESFKEMAKRIYERNQQW